MFNEYFSNIQERLFVLENPQNHKEGDNIKFKYSGSIVSGIVVKYDLYCGEGERFIGEGYMKDLVYRWDIKALLKDVIVNVNYESIQ